MSFLKDNLYHIFEVAKEERTDGDNFVGDMSLAHNLFLNGLEPDGKRYECMEELDKPALLEEWESIADQQEEFDGYHAILKEKYKALTAAFTTGDRETFTAVLDAPPAVEA